MSASTNPIFALINRLNERRNITRADVEAVVDMLIAQQFSEYVSDLRQSGLSSDEIEASIEIQTELAEEWKAQTLREVHETFFDAKGNTRTMLH